MYLTILTALHTLISLIGIATGLAWIFGLLKSKWRDGSNGIFLWTTVLTSATGYLFPFEKLLPSHIVGAISLVILAFAIFARYREHLHGAWGRVYVVTAAMALYLNVFVLVVQMFRKVSALHDLAPTQSEPPFAVVQLAVLLLFIAIGWLAVVRFRGTAVPNV